MLCRSYAPGTIIPEKRSEAKVNKVKVTKMVRDTQQSQMLAQTKFGFLPHIM